MNIIELAKEAGFDWHTGWTLEDDAPNRFEAFAALVAAQERKAWEHKFARLHQLMDIREIQPNKPCCLAARADEREACAALCFSIWNEWLDTPEEDRYKVLYDAEDCAAAIRARGTT